MWVRMKFIRSNLFCVRDLAFDSFLEYQEVVIAARLERATYCLEGSCSIQLSYATIIKKYKLDLEHFSACETSLNQ